LRKRNIDYARVINSIPDRYSRTNNDHIRILIAKFFNCNIAVGDHPTVLDLNPDVAVGEAFSNGVQIEIQTVLLGYRQQNVEFHRAATAIRDDQIKRRELIEFDRVTACPDCIRALWGFCSEKSNTNK